MEWVRGRMGQTMKLEVGCVSYDVVQSDAYLHFNGQEVWSLCDHDERQLLVSPRAHGDLLERILDEARRRIDIHLAREMTSVLSD